MLSALHGVAGVGQRCGTGLVACEVGALQDKLHIAPGFRFLTRIAVGFPSMCGSSPPMAQRLGSTLSVARWSSVTCPRGNFVFTHHVSAGNLPMVTALLRGQAGYFVRPYRFVGLRRPSQTLAVCGSSVGWGKGSGKHQVSGCILRGSHREDSFPRVWPRPGSSAGMHPGLGSGWCHSTSGNSGRLWRWARLHRGRCA